MGLILIVMCFLTIGSLVLGLLLVPFRDKSSKRYNKFLGDLSDYFGQAFGYLLVITIVGNLAILIIEALKN